MALLSMKCPACAGEQLIFLAIELPLKDISVGLCPVCSDWIVYRLEGKRSWLEALPEHVFENAPAVNHVARLAYRMREQRPYLQNPAFPPPSFPHALRCPWCGEMQFGAHCKIDETSKRGVAFTCIACDGPAVVKDGKPHRATPDEYSDLTETRWYIDSMYALFIAREAYRQLDTFQNRKAH